jgi:AcrR family transcriptional regulator
MAISVLKTKNQKSVQRKEGYHHGDLRQALVDAARHLVAKQGADNFTVSDACRLAGVSTAAPYKHFRDKDEILIAIVIEGFGQFFAKLQEAVKLHKAGSDESMIAMGQAYVAFAIKQPALFRLMFAKSKRISEDVLVSEAGRTCFQGVAQEVTAYCQTRALSCDPLKLTIDLWTFVHGVASLSIDHDYEKVTPGLDVNDLVATVTPRLLSEI